MPGVGWESSGSPESITIDFFGHQAQLYLFRIRRGDTEALELWASGETVTLFRSNISPIKFWARPLRHQSCVSKANAVPPPKSSAEIVTTHRTPSERSPF